MHQNQQVILSLLFYQDACERQIFASEITKIMACYSFASGVSRPLGVQFAACDHIVYSESTALAHICH